MLITIIFIIGYLAIAFEHPIKINKTASALLVGTICWTVYAMSGSDSHAIQEHLSHHLASIAEILFFLLGAMTIVELIDAHQGFKIITDQISSKSAVTLLWVISFLAFFLSAALDNLTTAIVMVSLLRKIIAHADQRKFFAGVVIIAANAGGAWSPIGDVTTTMLWIGGQIMAINIMKGLFIPSLISLVVPLAAISLKLKGQQIDSKLVEEKDFAETTAKERNTMFFVGLGSLLFVPIFKTITHLPPYMGMMLGLGVVWVVGEILHSAKDEEERKPFTASYALSRIDSSSILFFLGILLAIGCLESTGLLSNLAQSMNDSIGNQDLIILLIGLASSVVDNVPLVAATMGMYNLSTFPTDHRIWEFLAYCAGTGGSILIIGSAAGVAVMGMEKIDFIWYLKRISLLALLGYFAGAVVYIIL
ncbi:Citrate transporter [Emticicia oligotrophica DSM 17448]|uniref:Citrate transporter n=1 Tax=Emticicia oligotrophica (strain DSM 17448 / CIP 109782 / MTCC 6937 / GPTSA100-15) TaxID=929562 RepID=A0ABN4APZ6_EMTOG|nr:sodium:proton antiporter NhaD [Emticicia oligotrophica]AFK04236.1 Citrate transporter [Emticicia oligotrophica DSM 17448]